MKSIGSNNENWSLTKIKLLERHSKVRPAVLVGQLRAIRYRAGKNDRWPATMMVSFKMIDEKSFVVKQRLQRLVVKMQQVWAQLANATRPLKGRLVDIEIIEGLVKPTSVTRSIVYQTLSSLQMD
jgi:ribosomal protein L35AE/L33A